MGRRCYFGSISITLILANHRSFQIRVHRSKRKLLLPPACDVRLVTPRSSALLQVMNVSCTITTKKQSVAMVVGGRRLLKPQKGES
jgi:hypothetical protein